MYGTWKCILQTHRQKRGPKMMSILQKVVNIKDLKESSVLRVDVEGKLIHMWGC